MFPDCGGELEAVAGKSGAKDDIGVRRVAIDYEIVVRRARVQTDARRKHQAGELLLTEQPARVLDDLRVFLGVNRRSTVSGVVGSPPKWLAHFKPG